MVTKGWSAGGKEETQYPLLKTCSFFFFFFPVSAVWIERNYDLACGPMENFGFIILAHSVIGPVRTTNQNLKVIDFFFL